MSKIITDESELNTSLNDLITEDYALEILGLKNVADFRKFSRSFMKLSKIVKGIENSDSEKLDKDLVSEEYDTAKKIEDKIKDIHDKFKNLCPFKVGDIYLTTNSTNPSAIFLGTTWQKIEGRFLLGTTGGGASKQFGGSMSKTIAQANLPATKLTVDSFSLSRGNMDITGQYGRVTLRSEESQGVYASGAFQHTSISGSSFDGGSRWRSSILDFKASRNWTGTTSSASPQTSALGSGQPFDITPSYYTVHMWLRLT